MEDKLVTLAIHTYERAVILKSVLESRGIETCLHNVNLIQPVISAGVRVRIRESDLTAALSIIENLNFKNEDNLVHQYPPIVLVPVDFSESSLRVAKVAVHYAYQHNASVVLLHIYSSPYYAGGLPLTDAFVFDDHNEEVYKQLIRNNHESMNHLIQELQVAVAAGDIPDVQIIAKYREGVTEEQILIYSRKHKPIMVFLGCKEKSVSNRFSLGSVSTDLVDKSPVPVMVSPSTITFDQMNNIQSIGFVTTFEQKDLIAFHQLLKILNKTKLKVYFLHFYKQEKEWDSVQLNGVESYLQKEYPELESHLLQCQSRDAIGCIENLLESGQTDLLVFASQKRNLFLQFVNPDLPHKLVELGRVPLLMIPV